jgi:hypothetical protein
MLRRVGVVHSFWFENNANGNVSLSFIFLLPTIGFFRGTLGANETSGRPNRVSIPIIGISETDGTILASGFGQEVNMFFPLDGGAYGLHNGTSMAYVFFFLLVSTECPSQNYCSFIFTATTGLLM